MEKRLYLFQGGTLHCKEHHVKMHQGIDNNYAIPVPFYLLTHPSGHTLIDGGIPPEVAVDAASYWGDVINTYRPEVSEDDSCLAQLIKLGIDLQDIKFIVQTHLHLDHTGAIGRFPNATHIVQRKEYEYSQAPDWYSAGSYIKSDIDKAGQTWFFLDGNSNDYYDIYGDGSLLTVYTPGHSPGHQSILVSLPSGQKVIIAADAVYTLDHWNEKSLPGFLDSATDSVRSVKKLRILCEETNALLITGHDPDTWPTLRHSPEYYS